MAEIDGRGSKPLWRRHNLYEHTCRHAQSRHRDSHEAPTTVTAQVLTCHTRMATYQKQDRRDLWMR